MSAQARQFVVYPGGQPGREDAVPGREYQELWFKLARIPWASVVLVPTHSGGSVAEIATALADVGTSLRETPVTAIVAKTIDYGSARALAEMQPRLSSGGSWTATTVEIEKRRVEPDAPRTEAPHVATLLPPAGRAVIAIQPVVDEPLGIAIAQAADAVVLCIEFGEAQMDAARRTVELIGRERIIGALILRR